MKEGYRTKDRGKLSFVIAVLPALSLLIVLSLSAYSEGITAGAIVTLNSPTGREEINKFRITDSVFAKGSGLKPNRNYAIHIIKDTTIVEGMQIPTPVVDPTMVATDSSGYFAPTLIWSSPLKPGNYDIIADCQEEGVRGYYDDADAIDDMEVNDTAGFFVIPEVPLGTIMVLSACAAAFLIKRKI